jgi:hypothetical protein
MKLAVTPQNKNQTTATGAPLSLWHRLLAGLLRGVYFGRVDVRGVVPAVGDASHPRLIVSSHRNGAIDGYVVLRAFPRAQFLISVQLLRSRLMRVVFSGIPVVREKDRARYGIRRSAFADPIEASCAHLRAGGDLATFPEGSSEWGWRPLPYQRGAARIACRLLEEGVPVAVLPVGLFYARPDGFRSHVEIMRGPAVTLPARLDGEPPRQWELRVHQAIADALDAVSVHCRDEAHFAVAETWARRALVAGDSYAEAFLAAQRRDGLELPPLAPTPRRLHGVHWFWDGPLLAALTLSGLLVALVAGVAGAKADGRNTVSFFRIVAGFAASVVWLPVVVALTVWQPLPMLVLLALGALGWWRYPRMFAQE